MRIQFIIDGAFIKLLKSCGDKALLALCPNVTDENGLDVLISEGSFVVITVLNPLWWNIDGASKDWTSDKGIALRMKTSYLKRCSTAKNAYHLVEVNVTDENTVYVNNTQVRSRVNTQFIFNEGMDYENPDACIHAAATKLTVAETTQKLKDYEIAPEARTKDGSLNQSTELTVNVLTYMSHVSEWMEHKLDPMHTIHSGRIKADIVHVNRVWAAIIPSVRWWGM
jgi:hypothetical protein